MTKRNAPDLVDGNKKKKEEAACRRLSSVHNDPVGAGGTRKKLVKMKEISGSADAKCVSFGPVTISRLHSSHFVKKKKKKILWFEIYSAAKRGRCGHYFPLCVYVGRFYSLYAYLCVALKADKRRAGRKVYFGSCFICFIFFFKEKAKFLRFYLFASGRPVFFLSAGPDPQLSIIAPSRKPGRSGRVRSGHIF